MKTKERNPNMTDSEIITYLDKLHSTILDSSLATIVTEQEIHALMDAKEQLQNIQTIRLAQDTSEPIQFNWIEELMQYRRLQQMLGVPLEDFIKLCQTNIPDDCAYPQKAIILTDKDVDEWNKYKDAKQSIIDNTIDEFLKQVKLELNKIFGVKTSDT